MAVCNAAFGFYNVMTLPSGSWNHEKLPVGNGIGPTIFFPPSDSAFASAAGMSSVSLELWGMSYEI